MATDLADLLRRHAGDAGTEVAHEANARAGEIPRRADHDALYPLLAAIFGADRGGFGALVARFFAHGDTVQRAQMLDQLLAACPPASRTDGHDRNSAGDRVLLDENVGAQTLAAARYEDLTQGQVEAIANEARARNPAVVEAMSRYCAQHPPLLAALGGPTAAAALARMSGTGDEKKSS